MITPQGERSIKPEKSYKGIITIDQRVILDWLQFQGGRIRAAELNLMTGSLRLCIEHPDMPEVETGWAIKEVHPIYSIDYPSGKVTRVKE